MKGNLKMKRLNNKGFTLIELLAVIVILAIVVAITIPAVLSSINSARSSAFKTTAKTVADWAEREYQALMVNNSDIQKVDASFQSACSSIPLNGNGGSCTFDTDAKREAFLTAAGVNPKNYSDASVEILPNGRACVILTAAAGGDYDNEKTHQAKSPACS